MTHSCVWPASLSSCLLVCGCVCRRKNLLQVPIHSDMTCVTYFMCDMTHSCTWHYSHVCLDWLIIMCDMAHLAATRCEANAAAIHARIHNEMAHRLHNDMAHRLHNDMAHRLNVTWLTAVPRSCIWHDAFICLTWFVYMCDTWFVYMCDTGWVVCVTASHVAHINQAYEWVTSICVRLNESYVSSDSIICLIDMCNMTHWPKTRTHSQILQLSMYHLIVIWLVCDMTHPYTSYDSSICVDQVFLSVDGVVFLCVYRVFLSVFFLCVHTVLLSVVFPCVHRVFLYVHRLITCNVTQLQHTRVESQTAPFHVPNCALSFIVT